MEVTGKPERSVKTWTLFCFFLLVYFFNALWYLCVYTSATTGPVPAFYGESGPSSSPATAVGDWSVQPPDRDNLSFLADAWRMTRLVDLRDFRFLLNVAEPCGGVDPDQTGDGGSLFALVFVHSSPAHRENRRAIRQTWGSYANSNDTVRVVFMLGETDNATLQATIEAESRRHGDLVQGNFVDSYRNLTYKHVMGLKWVSHFCRRARFVFKVDDDVFVDLHQTVSLLRARYPDQTAAPRNLIMCFVYPKSFVKRSHRSKWQVAVREYGAHFYPPYCAGWGIVMSTDLVLNLYRHSSQIPYFWIDDVVVSGILVQRVGARHVGLVHRVGVSEAELGEWVASGEERAADAGPPYTFGVPDLHARAIYTLWNKTLRHYGALRKLGVTVTSLT